MKDIDKTLEHLMVVKRSGQRVNFNSAKIAVAIKLAFESCNQNLAEADVNKVYNSVLDYIVAVYEHRKTINVEDIQDIIEDNLKKSGYNDVYNSFNEYRLRRAASREVFSVKEQHKFVKAIEKIGLTVKDTKDSKPLNLMLGFGKTISQEFSEAYLIGNKYDRAYKEGRIYIAGLDTYALGITSSSCLNLQSLASNTISDFTIDLAKTVEHFKEEQDGEQVLADLNLYYQAVAINDFKGRLKSNLETILTMLGVYDYLAKGKLEEEINKITSIYVSEADFKDCILNPTLAYYFREIIAATRRDLATRVSDSITKFFQEIKSLLPIVGSNAISISLRYGNQPELLKFQEIYFESLSKVGPIANLTTIYKVNGEVPSVVLDAILGGQNILLLFRKDEECLSDGTFFLWGEAKTPKGQLILSKSAINLARLGLKYGPTTMKDFYQELDEVLELCKNQMLQRYEQQASKAKENYQFIFEQDYLYEGRKLEAGQKVRKVLRHGSCVIGFFGLGECLCALKHSKQIDTNLGLEILKHIQTKLQSYTQETKLNFICSEMLNEGVKEIHAIDKSMYGNVEVLKGNTYQSLASYLGSDLALVSAYQEECNFVYTSPGKALTKVKLQKLIQDASKKRVKVMKVGLKV